ncbi:MAG: cysteine--tRNA ligase [Thermoplasmata archaeon HGW-Thermoplasmata-1]|nr:MAG: cysteine--tRNA ligase [Thermoplasmata archaeon HGW-Thermoplasmata-1]
MVLNVYNSLTRGLEEFKPVSGNSKVGMYVCGMTVYAPTHIGHARTYVAFDIIRNYLQYRGYGVTYVQNVTDVNDKIDAAAAVVGEDPIEYARRYTEICLGSLDRLGVGRADVYPKVTCEMDAIIGFIKRIIGNGHAYESGGDVYFDVPGFSGYGGLSGQNVDELNAGARVEPGEKKRSPLDFALWKAAKPNEPNWDSPWGAGKPGWHIECSAMATKYLGESFDIHGGGRDLIFPHHENEAAQSMAATGKPFVKYWMHTGFLTVEGEKMSKSLGNTINLDELLKAQDPETVRFFYALTHYRSPIDFTGKGLDDAKKGIERIYRARDALEASAGGSPQSGGIEGKEPKTPSDRYVREIDDYVRGFEEAMDNDFGTPEAIARLFEFVTATNRYLSGGGVVAAVAAKAFEALEKTGRVLTLFTKERNAPGVPDASKAVLKTLLSENGRLAGENVEELMSALITLREDARKSRKWALSDRIRDELKRAGFEIQDTKEGTNWRYAG